MYPLSAVLIFIVDIPQDYYIAVFFNSFTSINVFCSKLGLHHLTFKGESLVIWFRHGFLTLPCAKKCFSRDVCIHEILFLRVTCLFRLTERVGIFSAVVVFMTFFDTSMLVAYIYFQNNHPPPFKGRMVHPYL